ncbi:MAG: zinc ribbon domain-containing protein [Acidimicrobiales bacterium]
MGAPIIEPALPRVLPTLTDHNRAFWTGGATGELLIQRCGACRRWMHPPAGPEACARRRTTERTRMSG